MSESGVEEVAIRYTITTHDDGTAKAVGSQKAVQDEMSKTNVVMRRNAAEYVSLGGKAVASSATVAGAHAKQASAVRASAEVMVASQKKVRDSAAALSTEWKAAAGVATSADEMIAKTRAETAVTTDKAAQKEIVKLRELGKTYQDIARMAADSAALRGRSAREAAASVDAAAKAEAAGVRSSAARPAMGARVRAGVRSGFGTAAAVGGQAIMGAGSLALGGLGIAGALTYEGIKKARGITETTLALRGATGLNTKQSMSLATIASATGVNPRSIGMAFNTLGGQLTKADQGSKGAVEGFQHLHISKAEASKYTNNLPGLFDLVTSKAAKLPSAERVSLQKQFLGRGTQVAGILTAGGPLAGQMKKVQSEMPGINPKQLKDMQESFIQMKIATTALELQFVQAFGPTLTKLLKMAVPLVKPLGAALQTVVKIVVGAVGVLVSGPVGQGLSSFGKQIIKAGGELLKAFKPAEPFFKNVLLPLIKGVVMGLSSSLLGAIKVLIPVVGVLSQVLGAVGKWLAPLKPLFQTLGMAIGIVFSGAILKAIAIVGKAGEAIPFLGKAIAPVTKAIDLLGTIFMKVFQPFGTVIKLAFGVAVAVVTTQWKAIETAFKLGVKMVEVAWEAIKTAFTVAGQALLGGLKSMLHDLESAWDTVKAILLAPFKLAWAAIELYLKTEVSVLTGLGKLVITGLGAVWNGIETVLVHPIQAAFTTVVSVIKGAISGVTGAIGEVVGAIGSAFSSAFGSIANIGKELIHAIISGITAAPKAILKAIESLLPAPLRGALGAVIGAAGSAGGAIAGGAKAIGGALGLAGGGWVPGDSHRDGTLAMLSGNEFVVTGPGQQMMEAEAPGLLDHLAANQAPHFAEGGWVIKTKAKRGHKPEKVNTYFDPTTGKTVHMTPKEHREYTRHKAEAKYQSKQGATVTASEFGGHNDPSAFNKSTASGVIANDNLWGFAELSNPPSSLNFSALGGLPMGTKIDVMYNGRKASVPKVDKGAGGPGLHGHIRAIDLGMAVVKALGFPGLADVQVAHAGSGLGGTGGLLNVSASKAVKVPKVMVPELSGEALNPVKAFQTGFQAGLKGQPLGTTDILAKAKAAARVTMKTLSTEEEGGPAAASSVGVRKKATTLAAGKPIPAAARAALGGVKSGVRRVAGAILGQFPSLVVTSTTGGVHAPNSLHYRGEAVDLGGSSGTMLSAAAWTNRTLASQLAEGIHNPNLSVAGGKQVSSSYWGPAVWSEHANHLHVGVTGMRRGGFMKRAPRRMPSRKFRAGGHVSAPRGAQHHGYHGFQQWARTQREGGYLYSPGEHKDIPAGAWLDLVRRYLKTDMKSLPAFADVNQWGPGDWYGKFVRGETYRRGGHVKKHGAVRATHHIAAHRTRANALHHIAAAGHHAARAALGRTRVTGALGAIGPAVSTSSLSQALAQLQVVSMPHEQAMPGGDVGQLIHQYGPGHEASGDFSKLEGASNTGPEANEAMSSLSGILDDTNKVVSGQLKAMADGLRKQLAKLRAHHGKPAKIRGLEEKLTDVNQAISESGSIGIQQLDGMAASLKHRIAGLKAHGGSKITERRLESALGLVEAAIGQRVGEMVKQVSDMGAALDHVNTAREQGLTMANVESGSSADIASQMQQTQTAMGVYRQQAVILEGALSQAVQAGDVQDAEQIKQQLEGIFGQINAAVVDYAKQARELIEQQAHEAVQQAEHNMAMSSGRMTLNVATRASRNLGEETPDEMRIRASEIQDQAKPGMNMWGLLAKEQNADLSVGNYKGAAEVQEKILAMQATIVNNTAEAAHLLRQAAETQAHIVTEMAQHSGNMVNYGLQSLELHQKLAGTYDTGGTQRAEYITKQVIPAMTAELAALGKEKETAEEQHDTKLAEQIAEQIAAKQNGILEAGVTAQEDTKSATQAMANAMANAGGSLGFQFNNQQFTDLIGINVGM